MMKKIVVIMLLCAVHCLSVNAERFCIAEKGKAAAIIVDAADDKTVVRVAHDLSADIQRVTGVEAKVMTQKKFKRGSIIVGTIGQSRLIDRLAEKGKLDVKDIKGQWEAYVIDVIDGCLVIAGSDRRGTAYGIYDISQRIGISPWYWWADVPVKRQSQLYYADGRYVQPSPSVKYRGIFINDEDWGLKPWATNNYEKELGDIGPKTYARVCELLLRLKANMLAPAMHECTGAFYSHPESKAVADSFGIIITTSHCEPLLLNNAAKTEWDQKRDGDWNYKTNRNAIKQKWHNRLAEASQYENIYTVAMRGLHDARLRGNLPLKERVALIDTVISDQRVMLEQHIGKKAHDIPQIFVPYKETMDIYENGLKVPDDITLVWVDDNYGYMKRVSNPQEQQRKGGAGVYYHLSYLGAPHDYLWLNSTPPVLMYEELMKAYHHGADRYWLLNVGDIKPMELGIQTFMDLAWDVNKYDIASINNHQAQMLAGLFGNEKKTDFQYLLDEYYRLAWSRKPEYMGWEYEWDDKAHTGLKSTEFSFQNYGDAQQRLVDYEHISDMAKRLSDGSAAYFEMVEYPVLASYQMNRKFLMAQLNQELSAAGRKAEANWAACQMQQAYDSINTLSNHYNSLLNGKWQGMMSVPKGLCALYQNKPEVTYTDGAGEKAVDLQSLVIHKSPESCLSIPLAKYASKGDSDQMVSGIGYNWQVMMLNEQVSYTIPATGTDSIDVTIYTVPFWPIYKGKGNAFSVSVDGGKEKIFNNRFREYSRTWKDQVLRNGAVFRHRFAVDKNKSSHTICFDSVDKGQMLQRVIIDWGGQKKTYVGF